MKVKLTLKEISTGVEKKFKLKKYVPCDQCHGTGAEGDGGSETCPTCKGSGSVIRNQQTILGTMQTRVTCSTCGGEGKIIKNKCKKCGGDGIIYGEEVVSVKIPAGVAEGMQLSMGGKGNAGKHNGVAGDLLILVEEEPHQDLIRDENDLIYNLLLSFPTAALGGAVEIPTIDGKVKVKIDSETLTPEILKSVGLSSEFDLAHPANADLEKALKSLGFPVGSEVIGVKYLVFDITQFTPLLGLYGLASHNFIITVVDQANNTRTATLALKSIAKKTE